jgi:hypothetical protein
MIMSKISSDRRKIDNEAVFRSYNEKIEQGFAEIRQLAKEDNQLGLVAESDSPLHFYCECSDENCKQRIRIQPSIYYKIHKKRDQFTVVCGHEVAQVERVVSQQPEFCVVKKFKAPSGKVDVLKKTDVDNT